MISTKKRNIKVGGTYNKYSLKMNLKNITTQEVKEKFSEIIEYLETCDSSFRDLEGKSPEQVAQDLMNEEERSKK